MIVIKTGDMKCCPECGGSDWRTKTEFHKAGCHIQFLIDRTLFCYDCAAGIIKYILDHPITSCDGCKGTPDCPSSSAAGEAIRQNYSIHQKRGTESSGDAGKYRPCKRGDSPRPKKSGYSWSDHQRIQKGEVRYNEKRGYWEKKTGQ